MKKTARQLLQEVLDNQSPVPSDLSLEIAQYLDRDPNNTDIIAYMAENNQDISLSYEFVGARTVKAGAIIEIGVSAQAGQQVMLSTMAGKPSHIPVLFVINMEQYHKAKEALK